jgi:hypothetical protein
MARNAQTVPQFNEPEWRLAVSQAPFPAGTSTGLDDRATPEPIINAARQKLVSARIQFLSPLLSQLGNLRKEPENDEYGILRPSEHAYAEACNTLIDAAIVLAQRFGRQVPYGCVSTDSEGGVRIVWMRPTKSVQVAIPRFANGVDYLYHEDGDKYDTEPLTTEGLARWLSLLGD